MSPRSTVSISMALVLATVIATRAYPSPDAPEAKSPAGPIGWRMDTKGSFPDVTPPLGWGPKSNVLWKATLPGYSAASPIIVGDRVIVMSDPHEMMCLEKMTGKQIWTFDADPDGLPKENLGEMIQSLKARGALDAEIAELTKQQAATEAEMKTKFSAALREKADDISIALTKTRARRATAGTPGKLKPNAAVGHTCATPISDGMSIVAVFNNGVVLCLAMDGKVRWATFLQGVNKGYGQSMSPAIAGDVVAVHIDDNLYGVDISSGKILWHHEELQHQGSPVAMKPGGRQVFLTTNGNVRDSKTGAVLATLAKPNINLFSTPSVNGDTAYFIAENRFLVSCNLALQSSGAITIKQDNLSLASGAFYASPCIVGNMAFLWNNGDYGLKKKMIHAYDIKARRNVYELPVNIDGWAYPSPTFAGGFLYVFGDSGDCQIYQPGMGSVGNIDATTLGSSKQYMLEPIGLFKLETMRSSPVFEGDRMYIRTSSALYCIQATRLDAKRGRDSVDRKLIEKESIRDRSLDTLLQDM